MTTATPLQTCPNCGSKLPEQPLSLCAYCAMPLGLDVPEQAAGAESPNAGRIRRVQEHESYAKALDWTPPESAEFHQALQVAYRAKMAAVVGAAILIATLILARGRGMTGALLHPAAWLGYALIALAIHLARRSSARRKLAVAKPVLKRPGLITDRRSDTRISGWSGSTCYYFQIEFEGGVVGEFAYAGRGANEEPYVTNLPGIAYTRGETLLAFKHIRV